MLLFNTPQGFTISTFFYFLIILSFPRSMDTTLLHDGAIRGAPLVHKSTITYASKPYGVPWIDIASPEYESKHEIYQLDNNFTPHAIARPRHGQDVAALVRYSIDSEVPLTVRSGGHDIFGRSMVESALCIDMRAIDFVEIVADKKSAKVGGGILMSKLIGDLSKEGLGTPFGSVSSIGYVGWASLGGYGALSEPWGLGVDQILGAKVVDAEGSLIEADDEMLKGIKGAGGKFGVVTELRIKVYELKSVSPSFGPLTCKYWWLADEHAQLTAFLRPHRPRFQREKRG
jgi:FAD binding domain